MTFYERGTYHHNHLDWKHCRKPSATVIPNCRNRWRNWRRS